MNIIYMHTHDSGRFLLPYGHLTPTPNLLDFAKESALFRHCYNAGPTCSPSRAALLTGSYPHVNGMLGLVHRGFSLKDNNMHLANFLKTKNYETALSGVQHEARNPKDLGYEIILGQKEGHDRDTGYALAAAEYIKNKKDKPFFLSFGMFNTHRVYPEVAEDIKQDYLTPPHVMYDNEQNRQDTAGYMTSARIMDNCAGIVLNAVKEAGIEDDTIIIFTTDHGIAFPHMKCHLYDTGIGVAFILKYPGNKMAGKALDSLVSHIDAFPTLCDLCGLEKPDWLQGVSMLPLLNGETDKIRDEIFSEITYHASYEPTRCIRTDRYKLIRRFDYHGGIVPSNIDDGPSKQFLLKNGFMDKIVPREMLFDLYLDPVERENLIGDSRYLNIYNSLSSRLSKWMEDTNDPLVSTLYRVKAPAGAVVNRLDSLHPQYEEYES